jgi:hypothetical protein
MSFIDINVKFAVSIYTICEQQKLQPLTAKLNRYLPKKLS